jgi:hypothetical protein
VYVALGVPLLRVHTPTIDIHVDVERSNTCNSNTPLHITVRRVRLIVDAPSISAEALHPIRVPAAPPSSRSPPKAIEVGVVDGVGWVDVVVFDAAFDGVYFEESAE